MKHLITILSIAALVSKALGLALESRATSVAESINDRGQSPRPTSGPHAAKAGLKRAHEIFARSAAPYGGVCGFIDQDAHSAVTCPVGYGCAVSLALRTPAFTVASNRLTENVIVVAIESASLNLLRCH